MQLVVSIRRILWFAVLMLSLTGLAQNDSLQLSPAIQNLALKKLPASFEEEYTPISFKIGDNE